MSQNRAGVLVKYNPCSIYARKGSVCPFFKHGSKRCSKPVLSCEMPEYNKWLKDVLAGKTQSYPSSKRRYLLEIPRVPLFLYHTHEGKIVGEAAINKVTKENGLFHYWFTEFILYPNFVDLGKLETSQSLQGLMRKGRSSGKYLNERTIKEIRDLCGLPTDIRKKLADELEVVEQKIAEAPVRRHAPSRRDGLAIARSKLKEIGLELHVDKTVLTMAEEILSRAEEKGMLRGRSALDVAYTSLFAACRASKIPIRTTEISRICGVNSKKLVRLYRTLRKFIGLTVMPLDPEYYISKYSQHLSVSQETEKIAMSIAKSAGKSLFLQRSPVVVAATAMYIAGMKQNECLSQKQIAKIFEITSASIRNCSKDLLPLI